MPRSVAHAVQPCRSCSCDRARGCKTSLTRGKYTREPNATVAARSFSLMLTGKFTSLF